MITEWQSNYKEAQVYMFWLGQYAMGQYRASGSGGAPIIPNEFGKGGGSFLVSGSGGKLGVSGSGGNTGVGGHRS